MRILPVPDNRDSKTPINDRPPAEAGSAPSSQGRKTQLRTGRLRRDAACTASDPTSFADTALSADVEDILFGNL